MKNIKLLLSTSIFFLCSTAFSQGWFSSFGSEMISEGANQITQTEDGGYFIHSDYGVQITPNKWGRLPLLLKYSSNGNLEWSKYFPKYQDKFSILSDDDGGFLIFGSDSNNESLLLKLDSQGDSVWQKSYAFDGENIAKDIVKTNDGFALLINAALDTVNGLWLVQIDSIGEIHVETFLPNTLYVNKYSLSSFLTYLGNDGFLIAESNVATTEDIKLTRVDSSGNILWDLVYGESDLKDYIRKLEFIEGGGFLITVETPGPGQIIQVAKNTLIRISDDGNILWEIEFGGIVDTGTRIVEIAQHPSGNFIIAGFNYDEYFIKDGQRFLAMINDNGEIIWLEDFNDEVEIYDDIYIGMTLSDSGNIFLTGTAFFNTDFRNLFVEKINSQGEQLWLKTYDYIKLSIGNDIDLTDDGGLIVCGEYIPYGYPNTDAFILKTDSLGNALTNFIEGYLHIDDVQNCVADTSEMTLEKWIVQSKYGLTITDTSGDFNFTTDSTNQEIEVFPPSPLWDYCLIPEIEFNGNFDTVSVEIGAISLADCPDLNVDITTPFLRRCFANTYFVNYCNTGTVSADIPYIQITLDTFLNFLNSSIPLASQNGNVLTFDLDTIGIGECGNFTIEVEVDCDAPLGMTHCVEAHIYPDSICIQTKEWSGGSVEVNGACVSDTIHFSIKNKGNSPLSPGLEYIVIEDDVILYQGQINQLGIGEVQEVSIANVGATYRLEADQEPNHPGISMPTYIIEGCGQGFTPGFVNQLPMDDADPFIDMDCRENEGSYDPNDKQAFPSGYGDFHYIEQNTDLEYLIRFQNTGTDTAFRVVIRDALSPFLDVASVRPGASSHPYEFDISGNGVLKFTFDDILLPDSTANEPASHGFVKFRISQKENVPLGSVIENTAAIYFDFNAPIFTNTTWHTVGEDFIPIMVTINKDISKNISVNVFPNPFYQKAIIELNGINLKGEKTFLLFNSTGQLIQESAFESNRFEINGGQLNNGVYYFKINNGEGVVVTGKVVVME